LACGEKNKSKKTNSNDDTQIKASSIDANDIDKKKNLEIIDKKRQKTKLGQTINTMANEYMPIVDNSGSKLYFSAMDRTGYFDFKLNYTVQKSAGGEDIYFSKLDEGVWNDARPISSINTNGHEVVSQVFENDDLLVTANYPEKLGTKDNKDAGFQSTDIFYLKKNNSSYQINHYPEPVNSIYTEADGWMNAEKSLMIFVSDRPGNTGEYHKKGWKWNESFWGNTDIYVSLKDHDYWRVPINIGNIVNSAGAERTPWLSEDELTLYLSSNGYEKNKTDLNIYAFKRKNKDSWTDWKGPYIIKDANTPYDDWGYKVSKNGDAYLASAIPLGFKPTQGGVSGDAGFRETNYRPGYELHGLQVASLNAEYETNIYVLRNIDSPTFIVNDVFFDFDSYRIKKSFEKYLELIVDQINQNKESVIEINGYTDNIGKKRYNIELSIKRAEIIKEYFILNGIKNMINTHGFGDENPIEPNTTNENRLRNRRVEIYLKTIDEK